jgi:hypothetical protein
MKMTLRFLCVAPLALAALISDFAQGQGASPQARMAAPNSSHHTPANALGASASAPGLQGQIFYPLDVSNPHNGPTIDQAQHHPIYLNQTPADLPDVATFLADLGAGQFIHVLDQYVKSSKDNRYTLGAQFGATLPVPSDNTFRPPHFFALLHAAAAKAGSGYEHIYHIFLPKGASACYFGDCYTPSNQATLTFCALHSSVTFSDSVGHVIFTLEPYLDSPVCSAFPGTPNGPLVDTTYTFLSHEVFETITDPDGDGWWIHDFTFAYGYEIADSCQRRPHGNVTLNGHIYNLQPEYSNRFHGCAYSLAPDGAWSNWEAVSYHGRDQAVFPGWRYYLQSSRIDSILHQVKKLGLHLEPRNGLLDLLVIDSADRTPTANWFAPSYLGICR